MRLTLRTEWMLPGHTPPDRYESPFKEWTCNPPFEDCRLAAEKAEPYIHDSLEAFAEELIDVLMAELISIGGGDPSTPTDVLVGGGYDSRILLFLLGELGRPVRCVTDGTEEPETTQLLDYLDVPAELRYVHDLDRADPYGIADATCEGFATLYSQMRFTPPDRQGRTLVTGLGGGEWFSYPASGWHDGKQHRTQHESVLDQWLDCWPQYPLIIKSWARGYDRMVNPYCSPAYASVAARCHREWMVETTPVMLDAVRLAMLEQLDPALAEIGWAPHVYDWRLTNEQADMIDERFASSKIGAAFGLGAGSPGSMHHANHACTLAGFATWVERLELSGHEVVW